MSDRDWPKTGDIATGRCGVGRAPWLPAHLLISDEVSDP